MRHFPFCRLPTSKERHFRLNPLLFSTLHPTTTTTSTSICSLLPPRRTSTTHGPRKDPIFALPSRHSRLPPLHHRHSHNHRPSSSSNPMPPPSPTSSSPTPYSRPRRRRPSRRPPTSPRARSGATASSSTLSAAARWSGSASAAASSASSATSSSPSSPSPSRRPHPPSSLSTPVRHAPPSCSTPTPPSSLSSLVRHLPLLPLLSCSASDEYHRKSPPRSVNWYQEAAAPGPSQTAHHKKRSRRKKILRWILGFFVGAIAGIHRLWGGVPSRAPQKQRLAHRHQEDLPFLSCSTPPSSLSSPVPSTDSPFLSYHTQLPHPSHIIHYIPLFPIPTQKKLHSTPSQS